MTVPSTCGTGKSSATDAADNTDLAFTGAEAVTIFAGTLMVVRRWAGHFAVILCLTAAVLSVPAAANPILVAGQSVTVFAAEDSYTRSNRPTTNFGEDVIIRVQPWGDMTGFVRFDLSEFHATGNVSTAVLNLPVDDLKVPGILNIHIVGEPWAESSITDNNAPLFGPAQVSVATGAIQNNVLSVDVSNVVNTLVADPANDFGIAITQSGANIWFDAIESGNAATLSVVPAGPLPNQPPSVDVGADRTVPLTDTLQLVASVVDDGLPNPPATTTVVWTQEAGAGIANFVNPTSVATDVSFSAPGNYVLRLTADDTALTGSDELSVTVVEPGGEQVFVVSEDSYVRANSAGQNFGADAILRVQPWGSMVGLANFDLSSIPASSVVTSAVLTVTVDDVKVNGPVSIHRILSPWTEMSVTANSAPALGPAEAGFSVSAAQNGSDVSVDVTDIVNDLLAQPPQNYGIAFTQGGANVWFASRESGQPMQLTLQGLGPPGNTPPQVDAGANQSVILPAAALLDGTVSDDGLPSPPGAVTIAWNVLSGPGAVSIANASAPMTSASFSVPGDYTIQLTANDSEFAVSDTLQVTVSDAIENQPPAVNAGGNSSGIVAVPVALAGSATDDGLPNPPGMLTTQWSVQSGPGNGDFSDAGSPNTSVSFDTAGTYTLRLTASDGAFQVFDETSVTINDQATETAFLAMADAYTRSNNAGTNFGADSRIRVQPWGNMSGFVRFDLSTFAGNSVSDARLRATVRTVTVPGVVSIHSVLGNWGEFTITANNQPTIGAPAHTGTVSSADVGGTVDIDVTGLVNSILSDPGNNFGIAISDAGANVWFGTIESGQPMQLILTEGPPPQPRFTDITLAAGVAGPAHFGGHGVQFADVNNDGLADFYVTMNDTSFGDMAELFYVGIDGNAFAERGAANGIANFDTGSHGGVWFDFDNDGDYDLYNGSYDQNRLFENDASGLFVDITSAAMLPVREWPTRGVAVFDFELDGDLDIVAINGSAGSNDPPSERNEFYRNNGNGTFTTDNIEPLFSATAGQGITDVDYDNDGDIDLFAGNRNGAPIILRNNAGTAFQLIDPASIGIVHVAGDGITFGDIDNDGDLDAILDDQLYEADGDGTFTHRGTLAGPEIPYMGGFSDLDNDGDIDVVMPGANFVYWNDGAGNFSAGENFLIGNIDDPRSVAFSDIDNDGDNDFFFGQKDTFNVLVRNDYTGSNRWLRINVRRANNQIGAPGARVYVYTAGEIGNAAQLITWREIRSQDGYLSQSDPNVLLGVAGNTVVDVRVVFPGGSTSDLPGIATNQSVEVVE